MARRVRARYTGAVQGVGFRPTVVRIARELELTGAVWNDPHGATAEIQGLHESVDEFLRRMESELPPLARIESVSLDELDLEDELEFRVVESAAGERREALVPPDAALCEDCRRDMEDSENKRYRYEFTTCTNCGPRYSLVRDLPYDRQRTAMACFPLCPDCDREYRDVVDRRFHAEPVCCPQCGPKLWITNAAGALLAEGDGALQRAREALLAGSVVAVKGLGGFQLACRADEIEVIARLRYKKHREGKPFAIMVRDLEAADALVHLGDGDRKLLSSAKSPITLAPCREMGTVVQEVAPGLNDLGVMLPTTPLHVELFRAPEMPPLVMTSANVSDEPICRTNREAASRLAEIVDYFLFHDRDVVRRVDDSVVRSGSSGPFLVRRSRGWVPEPLPLPCSSADPVLAVGGHLQTTVCLAVGDQAFPSQHIGDLDSESARRFHLEVIDGLEQFLQVRPSVLVSDLHPDYPATWAARDLATERQGTHLEVQHHLAHIASVLGEHACFPVGDDTVLGVALDGTGWGGDGTVWGGEWLSLDARLGWQRLASLVPMSLVGGEIAVREPWRIAAGELIRAGEHGALSKLPLGARIAHRLEDFARIATSPTWPMSTGAGRLFEAAGSLIADVDVNSWEGEAAARLEALASTRPDALQPWEGLRFTRDGRMLRLPGPKLLIEAAQRLVDGENPAVVAAGFHATFAELVAQLANELVGEFSPSVPIGGGCLVNRLLRSQISDRLSTFRLEALLPTRLPPGDGGLSYGQTVLAVVSRCLGVEPQMRQ